MPEPSLAPSEPEWNGQSRSVFDIERLRGSTGQKSYRRCRETDDLPPNAACRRRVEFFVVAAQPHASLGCLPRPTQTRPRRKAGIPNALAILTSNGRVAGYPTATAPWSRSNCSFRFQFWCQLDFKFRAGQCRVVLGRNLRKALSELGFRLIVQKRAKQCADRRID